MANAGDQNDVKQQRREGDETGRKSSRAGHDPSTGRPERQLDDNQDDLGRDANDPGKISNDINKAFKSGA
jgi:hypothetical protein